MIEDPNTSDGEGESQSLDMFADPEDYYPPSPKPTTATHTLLSGEILTLRLVGHNPLWGHHLWQAGRLISTYFETHPSLITSRSILELGAGAGLPSLICYHLGASSVLITDYPDPDLISNLQINIDNYLSTHKGEKGEEGEERKIEAKGYCWGADSEPLLSTIANSAEPEAGEKGFDILILADLLFNHSEHAKLLSTVQATLKKTKEAKALVFFSPYRPWLYEADMKFFDLCREAGLVVEKILEEKMEKVMFEEDRGDEELRRTVFGWEVKWDL